MLLVYAPWISCNPLTGLWIGCPCSLPHIQHSLPTYPLKTKFGIRIYSPFPQVPPGTNSLLVKNKTRVRRPWPHEHGRAGNGVPYSCLDNALTRMAHGTDEVAGGTTAFLRRYQGIGSVLVSVPTKSFHASHLLASHGTNPSTGWECRVTLDGDL